MCRQGLNYLLIKLGHVPAELTVRLLVALAQTWSATG